MGGGEGPISFLDAYPVPLHGLFLLLGFAAFIPCPDSRNFPPPELRLPPFQCPARTVHIDPLSRGIFR